MLAAKAFLSKWWPWILVAVIAAGVAGAGVYLYNRGEDAGQGKADKARLEGNVDALENKSAADTAAAGERVDDNVRAAEEARELKEAVKDAPDPATARRRFYECRRLQQSARAAGNPTPACS